MVKILLLIRALLFSDGDSKKYFFIPKAPGQKMPFLFTIMSP